MNITIETKTNGYTAEALQPMKETFEKVAANLFPGCTVRHFYYGDGLDMADIVIRPGRYAHFSISKNRVSLTGYECDGESLRKFMTMTYNDECYGCGRLLKLAEKI